MNKSDNLDVDSKSAVSGNAHRGSKMMHRDNNCCWVHPEEFEQRLQEGWQFGGLPRKVDRSGSNNPGYGKNYHEGWIWIHKGSDRQYIKADELEDWLSKGYFRGMGGKDPIEIPECQLRDFYRDHSDEATVSHFGVSTYFITKWLKYYGIPKHTKAEARRLTAKNDRELKYPHEKVLAFYAEHTAVDTCKQFGFSVAILDAILEDYGIPHKSLQQVRACQAKDHPVSDVTRAEWTLKAIQTKLHKYGTLSPNKAGVESTCMERYGVPNVLLSPEIQAKAQATKRSRPSEIKTSWSQKRSQTMLDRYGATVPLRVPEFQEKQKQTCLEKYGVPYNCMRKEARIAGNNSKPNQQFESELIARDIPYCREVSLDSYTYDFQVGNILVEINPYPTHNSTWGVYGNSAKDISYHQLKTQLATSHQYRCIHVFDWDDQVKILDQLIPITYRIGARKLSLQEVNSSEEKSFLNSYHLQGAVKSVVALGLYFEDQLVQLMTFGKPRYNKSYQWELLRLCTKPGWMIAGGSERLFKAFRQQYDPISVLSYCDLSKFDGQVYSRLGF